MIIINCIYTFICRIIRLIIHFIKKYFYNFPSFEVDKVILLPTNEKPKVILSWNIQELFLFTNKLKITNIIKYLKRTNADIVCLQEAFEDKAKTRITEGLKEKYPYHLVGNSKKSYIVGEDSGLLVLSKYPIIKIKFTPLKDLVLTDDLANKGILYFTVQGVNFVNTHLQAFFETISMKQIQQLKEESPFNNQNYIVTGDLNNTNAHTFFGIKPNNKTITFPEDNEILDYIIPINQETENKIKIKTKVKKINLENTSDHYPIKGYIKYL